MTHIIGIDPGPMQSGFVLIKTGCSHYANIAYAGVESNKAVCHLIRFYGLSLNDSPVHVAIEDIVSYGKAIGKSTIETAVWLGRFIEQCGLVDVPIFRYPRREYGLWVTGGSPVSDVSIRAALESIFGEYGKGFPLHPLRGASDKRSAFAVAKYHEFKKGLHE